MPFHDVPLCISNAEPDPAKAINADPSGSRTLSGLSVGDPDPNQNVTDVPNTGWEKNTFGYTALKWAVLWFAYDMLPLEVGEEGTRQLTSRHRGSRPSEETAPTTSIYVFFNYDTY